MKNDGLLIYNLGAMWQSPSLRVNLVKTLQDADSYLGCLALTACPRVWRAGWRTEGCGETECDHNWGCCRNPPLHNLTKTKRSTVKVPLKVFCLVESLEDNLVIYERIGKLWKVSRVSSVMSTTSSSCHYRETFINPLNPAVLYIFSPHCLPAYHTWM